MYKSENIVGLLKHAAGRYLDAGDVESHQMAMDYAYAVREMALELAGHRGFIELITDGGRDYPEDFDRMVEFGLVMEVPASEEFIAEWGDDCEMYVLSWSEEAEKSRAADAALGVKFLGD